MSKKSSAGVELPEGASGASLFHDLLLSAVRRFPSLAAAKLPEDPKAFRAGFATAVPRFEAARVASADRLAIAAHIRGLVAERMTFIGPNGDAAPLWGALEGAPYAVRAVPTRGPGALTPTVEAPTGALAGGGLRAWIQGRVDAHQMSQDAAASLGKLVDRGTISLKGERFVILGAGAELSPVATLLAAGADVLWIDVRPPPDALVHANDLGGVLHVPDGPGDLLAATPRIAATVRAFASEGAVHIGQYAYAGGAGREWRLAEAMNAITASIPANHVKSVSMLVSPTTAVRARPADVAIADGRFESASLRFRSLARAGLLKERAARVGDVVVPYALVPLQGAGYQAAQYVGKLLAAEVLGTSPGAPTISANVAPITATRSLTHPLFEAGFLAAVDIGVLISPSETTRTAQALMMISDVTDPGALGASGRAWPTLEDRADALSRTQFHGGVFNQPYGFDGLIAMSAVIGLGRKPSLLWKLIKGGR